MIKAIVGLHRRPDMSREEFREYFQTTHAPLLRQLPGLRRLVVNFALPGPDGEPTYDGFGEDWFDSPEAMAAAFASPQGQAVMADAPNFIDVSRVQIVVVDEDEVPLVAS